MSIRSALAGLLFASPALACDPALPGSDARRVEGERYVLAWRALPGPIRLGEFFALEIAVCARSGASPPAALRVDAQMPEHRHGMNYRPSVARAGEGRFIASGLLFHMPGRWEFSFELRAAEQSETLQASVPIH
jgi:hypothetical protein